MDGKKEYEKLAERASRGVTGGVGEALMEKLRRSGIDVDDPDVMRALAAGATEDLAEQGRRMRERRGD